MAKITLKQILCYVAAVLGILTFIMIFLKAGKADGGSFKGSEIAFGHKESIPGMGKVTMMKFNIIAFLAYILPLVAGIVAAVFTLLGKDNRIVTFVCAGLMILGAILIFCLPTYWYMFAAKDWKDTLKELDIKPAIGGILAGIFAILGGGCLIASEFVKKNNNN